MQNHFRRRHFVTQCPSTESSQSMEQLRLCLINTFESIQSLFLAAENPFPDH